MYRSELQDLLRGSIYILTGDVVAGLWGQDQGQSARQHPLFRQLPESQNYCAGSGEQQRLADLLCYLTETPFLLKSPCLQEPIAKHLFMMKDA